MNDRVVVILRIVGIISMVIGILIGYFAATTSPALYPPLLASYLIVAAVLAGAGFLTLISRFVE